MHRSWKLPALLAIAAAVTGCTTANGTSFGLPDAALSAVDTTSLRSVHSSLQIRRTDYVKAAQGAANGSQLFDVPSILAGTAGVASAAFGLENDLAPSAGTLAAGALGFRSYYNAGSRYPAYVGAARGLSCLEQAVGALDTLQFDGGLQALSTIAAADDLPADVRDDARRSVARLRSVPWRLAGGAGRIDDEVLRKLAAPAAPNLAGFYLNYDAAVRSGEQQRENNEEAREEVAAEIAEVEQEIARVKDAANRSRDQGEKQSLTDRADALEAQKDLLERVRDILSDHSALLVLESELDARIEQCVAMAA